MVTIKDIAKNLNLSVSAVSRALSQNKQIVELVNAKDRDLILNTAKELGYKRNRQAEFLQQGKNADIGVFVPDIADHQMCEFIFGITQEASRHGFPVNIHPEMDGSAFEHFITNNLHNPSAGIITYPTSYQSGNSLALLQEYFQKNHNVLMINSSEKLDKIATLNMNETLGGKLAAEVLRQHNCELYLHCDAVRYVARQRVSGFTETLKNCAHEGIPRDADDSFWQKILQSHHRIGIFARHDRMAAEYMRQISRLGSKIGEDIFIVGYDNNPLGAYLPIPLTTIEQPFRSEGGMAIEMLLGLIYKKKVVDCTIDPKLIKRGSA